MRSHPDGLIFHTAAWARVLVDTYRYEPRYHVLLAGDEIAAAWPAMLVSSRLTGRRLVSLPFSDHVHPLATSPEQLEMLLSSLTADAHELCANHIELRGWPHVVMAPPAQLASVSYYGLYTLDLTVGPDALLKSMHNSTYRCIKQARKRGVSVRFADSRADLDLFCRLNSEQRRRQAMLTQPRRFFSSIHRHLLEPGIAHLVVAECNGTIAAAVLFAVHQNTAVGKFSVSDPAYWAQRPNHLAQWHCFEWACEQGLRWYDMGRTGPADTGLARYKSQWGAERTELPYFYHPKVGGLSSTEPAGMKKLVLSSFSRFAPRPVFNTVGGLAYRHLG